MIYQVLSIADATAFEDAGSMKFTVSLSEAFPGNIVFFTYKAIPSSARAYLDYTPKYRTASIAAGTTKAELFITIINDSLVEDDETFLVEISNPHNATIDISRATGTIKINDLSLSIADAIAFEDAGQIEFIVSLSALFPGSKAVTFNYRTLGSSSANSAIAGTDYTSKTGRATIASGELTTSILIDISDDSLVEDDKTFLVEISENELAIPIIKSQARGTIKINDLSLSIANATAFEDAGQIEFTVSLSEAFPGSKAVSFNYHTLDSGSAIAGADYTSVVAGSATIASGELTTSILIDISNDTLVEDDETF